MSADGIMDVLVDWLLCELYEFVYCVRIERIIYLRSSHTRRFCDAFFDDGLDWLGAELRRWGSVCTCGACGQGVGGLFVGGDIVGQGGLS